MDTSLTDGSGLIEIRVAYSAAGENLRLQLDGICRQLGIDRPAIAVGRQLHGQSGPGRGSVDLIQHRVFGERRSVPQRFLEYASLNVGHAQPENARDCRRDVHVRRGQWIGEAGLELWTAR